MCRFWGQTGVGVYISEQIPFIRRPELEKEGVECIWLEILNPKAKGFLVGIIYKPPDSSNHLVENFEYKLDELLSDITAENKETILTGDINCN